MLSDSDIKTLKHHIKVKQAKIDKYYVLSIILEGGEAIEIEIAEMTEIIQSKLLNKYPHWGKNITSMFIIARYDKEVKVRCYTRNSGENTVLEETIIHSEILGIINSKYNNKKITDFKILPYIKPDDVGII